MASNKWLNDLKTLKTTTNTLRNTLRDKKVPAYDTDTLSTLVSKVPTLAPITLSDEDKWQPDPLWKFPDPNGSGEMKTIRQIYDEDVMANDYKYRAIYQITDDYDTLDLKATMGARTSADTFLLSDGSVYTNITTKTLIHTWDKSKDVMDSKGRKMRYIRVYTNSVYSYALGFDRSSVWGIHCLSSLGSSPSFDTSSFAKPHSCAYAPLECFEIEAPASATSTYNGTTGIASLKKLVINAPCNLTNGFSGSYNLKEMVFSDLRGLNLSEALGSQMSRMSFLTLIPETYTSTVFRLSNSTGVQVDEFRGLSELNTVTSLILNNQFKVESLMCPQNIKSLELTYAYNLKQLYIPYTCESVSVQYCYMLRDITIPASVKSCNLSYNYNLRTVNLPLDFNVAINLSSAAYMTHESLVDILNALKDLTGETSKKLTLGTTNLAKLSDEEKLIATNKNWTLA